MSSIELKLRQHASAIESQFAAIDLLASEVKVADGLLYEAYMDGAFAAAEDRAAKLQTDELEWQHRQWRDSGDWPHCGLAETLWGGWGRFHRPDYRDSDGEYPDLNRETLPALLRLVADRVRTTASGDPQPFVSSMVSRELDPEARALAILTKHPGWTVKQIAEAAGVNRGSLYRMKRFTSARRIMKQHAKVGYSERQDRKQGISEREI